MIGIRKSHDELVPSQEGAENGTTTAARAGSNPVLTSKITIMKCFDKFDVELKEGDIVDVQNCGEHKIYKKEDGELYFKPYDVEEKVGDYFSNDMIKVE